MVEKLKEQIYVIPLRDVQHTPRWERGKRAMKAIRDYLGQHMKVGSDEIKLDQSINEMVWERGSHKPPSRIRVRAMKFEDGQVQAELAEE
ncbi:MAG TPA: 50S ribosomal protein L31e [Methanomicrobiales archaeon]|nr:50S ribosomal protein L31e [Methanomicrobiales archaeon]